MQWPKPAESDVWNAEVEHRQVDLESDQQSDQHANRTPDHGCQGKISYGPVIIFKCLNRHISVLPHFIPFLLIFIISDAMFPVVQ